MTSPRLQKIFDNDPHHLLDDFDQALQEWIKRVNKIHHDPVSIQNDGKKFIRIAHDSNGHPQSAVVCFIDKATGDVLFPAGWKAPTKHSPVRGNIWTPGDEGIEKWGAKYIKKG